MSNVRLSETQAASEHLTPSNTCLKPQKEQDESVSFSPDWQLNIKIWYESYVVCRKGQVLVVPDESMTHLRLLNPTLLLQAQCRNLDTLLNYSISSFGHKIMLLTPLFFSMW